MENLHFLSEKRLKIETQIHFTGSCSCSANSHKMTYQLYQGIFPILYVTEILENHVRTCFELKGNFQTLPTIL